MICVRIDSAAGSFWATPSALPIESLARRSAQLVELARRTPRLAGAATLVAAFDAALTFPPRRRSRSELPQGGYADVSTRGDPDPTTLIPWPLFLRIVELEIVGEEALTSTPPSSAW